MKTSFAISALSLILLSAVSSAAYADRDPNRPVEHVPFQPANMIEPVVTVAVAYERSSRLFRYNYAVSSGQASLQPIITFNVLTSAAIAGSAKPVGWAPVVLNHQKLPQLRGPDLVMFVSGEVEDAIQPAHHLDGFALESLAPPCVGQTYLQGDVPPPTVQQVIDYPPGSSSRPEIDSFHVTTVIPDSTLAQPGDSAAQIVHIGDMVSQAVSAGWISDPQLASNIQTELAEALAKVTSPKEAADILVDLISDVKGHTTGIKPEAVSLLEANLDQVIITLNPAQQLSHLRPAPRDHQTPGPLAPIVAVVLITAAGAGLARWA